MVIAQAAAEYGSLTQAFSAVTNAGTMLQQELRQLDPMTWMFIGIASVGIWFFLRR